MPSSDNAVPPAVVGMDTMPPALVEPVSVTANVPGLWSTTRYDFFAYSRVEIEISEATGQLQFGEIDEKSEKIGNGCL